MGHLRLEGFSALIYHGRLVGATRPTLQLMACWPPLVRWLGAIFGIGFCPFSGVKNRLLLGVFVVIKGGEVESPLTRSEVVVDRGVESGDRRGGTCSRAEGVAAARRIMANNGARTELLSAWAWPVI